MAGTIVTERVAGIPSGFPAEMDASVKVRWVAPLLMNMSERSADLLKYFGGVEQFSFTNTTIEWVEDDVWSRRLSHSGLGAGTTTALTLVGAHRFPIGTILFHSADGEYARITGHNSTTSVNVMRDITSDVTEGAWGSTDEVIVVGLSMDENDDYVFRPTSIFSLPYNRPQVFQAGVQASFRRMETQIYGLRGSDLDTQAANLVAEQFVGIEDAVIHGRRFDGTPAVPAMMGGLKFFITSTNGAQVTNLSSAAMTRKDLDDLLQLLWISVGADKMADTLLVGAWPKRKIDSFFAAGERTSAQTSGAAGVVVDKLNTSFGVINVMLHQALAANEAFLVKKDQIQIGHHGQLGKPQLRLLPPSTVGPRSQKVFYADLSMIVAGVQAMARLYGFSITA